VGAIALGLAVSGGLLAACNQILGNEEPRLAADAMATESGKDAGRDVMTTPCADGAVPGDATRFCAARRAAGCNDFVCSDFDEGDASFDAWTPQLTDGGTLTLDDTTYVSPPTSLRTFVPAGTNPGGLQAALATNNFPGTLEGMRVHAEFDALLCNSEVNEGGPSEGSGFLVAQVVQDFCYGVDLLLLEGPAGPSLVANVVLPDTTTPPQTNLIGIGPGWTHIILDTTLSKSNGNVLVNVGGNSETLGPLPTLAPGGDEYFWLGPFTFETTPRCPMLFDNIWVSLTPAP
jgi:hypothetical protein